ncbi:hypothetical protein [Actinobacillus seminis]|nr:hypothetical protein [Actinobacillus seminis]
MMKKISLATILVLSTVSITATAAGGFQNGNSDRSRHEMMRSGRFINANQPVTTIAQGKYLER